jgi:hypothetical protein
VKESSLTLMCGFLPQQYASLWVGTLDPKIEMLPSALTRFHVVQLNGLSGLTREDAGVAMKEWGGKQYADDVLDQVHLFSCGVPRLLEAAFNATGELATNHSAMNAMSAYREGSYTDAARWFRDTPIEAVCMLLLCAATNFPYKNTTFPTIPKFEWSDVFFHAAAFPTDSGSVAVPRYWWQPRAADVKTQMLKWNLHMDDLLLDPIAILSSKTSGATATGVPWEKLFANALAARFRVHCAAKNLNPAPFVPVLDIYPTTNAHVQEVLGDFEVCLTGVSYPDAEVSVTDAVSLAGSSILVNFKQPSAHHDVLIPAKRKSTGASEFIVVQCRNGTRKYAHDLTKTAQHLTKKDGCEMTNVLLQLCDGGEGKQRFQKAKKTGAFSWKDRQDNKRYALISGKSIVAQWTSGCASNMRKKAMCGRAKRIT